MEYQVEFLTEAEADKLLKKPSKPFFTRLPLQLLGYTPREFDKMLTEGTPFILEVLEKGKVI